MRLYRPVGVVELELIAASGWTAYPPRLEHQPIFYPVLNFTYAEAIAKNWNTKDDNSGCAGFVTEFDIDCLVMQIPETLHPLVTDLDVGDALFLKDLELPEGVVALAEPDLRIAIVRAAAIEVEETDEEEAGETTTAEPERIGRVRKDEDEGSKD